ncbi:MAG: DUF1566 domain-containing protein [Deltaproteobacteria bacterium]|nr:DUF1566 domain-containing protein [Deltaproteobacteria bacterium]
MRCKVFAIALLLTACARGPEGTEPGDCDDGQDNDTDVKVDCEDEGCATAEHCVAQVEQARSAEQKIAAERAKAEVDQKLMAEQEAALPYFEAGGVWVQREHNGSNTAYYGAEAYCEKLSLGGKDDWRLPTEKEAITAAKSGKLKHEPYAMWTSTKLGKKRGTIVGTTSAAANELGLVYDGDCRARCVRSP